MLTCPYERRNEKEGKQTIRPLEYYKLLIVEIQDYKWNYLQNTALCSNILHTVFYWDLFFFVLV